MVKQTNKNVINQLETMTSYQDILAFLQADQEARAKEKDEDKETRARERQEDRENILAMIKTGVQKEVKAAIKDVEERLGQQEKVNEELTMQLSSLVENMEAIQESVRGQQAFPALPGPRYTHPSSDMRLEEICGWRDGML